MKRRCGNCGAVIDDPDQNFCLVCGHILDDPSPRKSRSPWSFIIIAAAAAAVIAGALYFYARKSTLEIDPDIYAGVMGYDGYSTFLYDYDSLFADISSGKTSSSQQTPLEKKDLSDHFHAEFVCDDTADPDSLENGYTYHVLYTIDSDF